MEQLDKPSKIGRIHYIINQGSKSVTVTSLVTRSSRMGSYGYKTEHGLMKNLKQAVNRLISYGHQITKVEVLEISQCVLSTTEVTKEDL